MKTFNEIQETHEDILKHLDQCDDKKELIESVKSFLKEIELSSSDIPDNVQRESLRAILRFWSAFIYEQTNEFPQITLRPINPRSMIELSRLRYALRVGRDIKILGEAIKDAERLNAEGLLDNELQDLLKDASQIYEQKRIEQGVITTRSMMGDLEDLYWSIKKVEESINYGEESWIDPYTGEIRPIEVTLRNLHDLSRERENDFVLQEIQKINRLLPEDALIAQDRIQGVLGKPYIRNENKHQLEEKLEEVKKLIAAKNAAIKLIQKSEQVNDPVKQYELVSQAQMVFPSSEISRRKEEAYEYLVNCQTIRINKVSSEVQAMIKENNLSEAEHLLDQNRAVIEKSFDGKLPNGIQDLLYSCEKLRQQIYTAKKFDFLINQIKESINAENLGVAEKLIDEISRGDFQTIPNYSAFLKEYREKIRIIRNEHILLPYLEDLQHLLSESYEYRNPEKLIMRFLTTAQLEREIKVVNDILSITAKKIEPYFLRFIQSLTSGDTFFPFPKYLSVGELIARNGNRIRLLEDVLQVRQSRFRDLLNDQLEKILLQEREISFRNVNLLNDLFIICEDLSSEDIWMASVLSNDFRKIQSRLENANQIISESKLEYIPVDIEGYVKQFRELQQLVKYIDIHWKEIREKFITENFDEIPALLHQIKVKAFEIESYRIFLPNIESRCQLYDIVTNEQVKGWHHLLEVINIKTINIEKGNLLKENIDSMFESIVSSIRNLKDCEAKDIPLSVKLLQWMQLKKPTEQALNYQQNLEVIKDDSRKVIELKQEMRRRILQIEKCNEEIGLSINEISQEIDSLGGFPINEECTKALKSKNGPHIKELLLRAELIGPQSSLEETLITQLVDGLKKSQQPFWKFWK